MPLKAARREPAAVLTADGFNTNAPAPAVPVLGLQAPRWSCGDHPREPQQPHPETAASVSSPTCGLLHFQAY